MNDAGSLATPNKLLNLPDGLRTKAFRAVELVLRTDPVLAGIVQTWRSREGQSYEADFADPAFDACPMIALSPVPRADTRQSIRSAEINFVIAVQVCVQGTCIDDSLNLWDAISDAFALSKPFQGTDVYQFLRCGIPGVSINDISVVDPAFLERLPLIGSTANDSPEVTWGKGTISFSFQRSR